MVASVRRGFFILFLAHLLLRQFLQIALFAFFKLVLATHEIINLLLFVLLFLLVTL